MNDYEAKFWLPFKGVTKPVYAIPGNHDWYDALEAFAATFLEPGAARAAMRARVESDLRLTSTTDARIEELIREARRGCGSSTACRRVFSARPFFEIQTDRFALICRRHRRRQARRSGADWRGCGRRSIAREGKTTMAILGHPVLCRRVRA